MVFLFPGQGSQFVGMGKDLILLDTRIQELFDCAQDLLQYDIQKLCFDGPIEELSKTEYTQIALLVYHAGVIFLLKQRGIQPSCVAGHSLGEFSALLAAEVFDFETVLHIVKYRAQLMAQSDPLNKGGMIAVLGLEDDTVSAICDELTAMKCYIAPANFNTPGQVVVSGEKEVLMDATPIFLNRGAKKVIPLSVSGAFHSKLMDDSACLFADYLQTISFKPSQCPVLSNVTGEFYSDNFIDLLSLQMNHPVQWAKSMQYLAMQGFHEGLDVGPGSVLQGMMRRISEKIYVQKADEILSR